MAFDPYSPCACGSGKKFKWCCQPIEGQLEKAFRLDADGQHDAALRIMDELVTAHPANPEAWGRKAQLLYLNGRLDEAENAVQKAMEINPQYPFGYVLRGGFRQQEHEWAGAALLYRKAAELYDPAAKEPLADVYYLIVNAELKLNRPIAARAALEMCLHLRPNEELSREMDELFGSKSHLPEAARRAYTFASPPSTAAGERRAAWSRALAGAATGKLTDAARAFEQLVAEDPNDAAAQYNLGLVRAWLGDNKAALEALDRYVALEPDEKRAAEAWTLGEVLRFGQGMEDQADVEAREPLDQPVRGNELRERDAAGEPAALDLPPEPVVVGTDDAQRDLRARRALGRAQDVLERPARTHRRLVDRKQGSIRGGLRWLRLIAIGTVRDDQGRPAEPKQAA